MSGYAFAQSEFTEIFRHEEAQTSILGIQLDDSLLHEVNSGNAIKLKCAIQFTSCAIGWMGNNSFADPGQFTIKYRIHKPEKGWTEWKDEEGYHHPDDNMRHLYFTELLFGMDELLHDSIEFILNAPFGESFTELHLVLQDMSGQTFPESDFQITTEKTQSKGCPEFPDYIPRSAWCGSYQLCHTPTYSVIYRTPTHTVVHHGASPDSYTDGYAVVRSYWNYHVNTLGWSDIGYNYLFDKYGNFFQGRHNPNIPLQDVNAAHAGSANPYSIGLNFLGNADVTLPTTSQIQKCNEFMAWWYDYKGFDPTSSASILCQDGITRTLPRICGHKDVNPGGTACPGTTLYALLPSFRTTTNQIILDCDAPSDTAKPTTSITTNRDWQCCDFEVQFSDEDNVGGSGIMQSFYQVMDYNGAEWRANSTHGFFNDNFTTSIHPDWTNLSGTWSISSGHLLQSDEAITNPNIYALVSQTINKTYLFHWQMKISGAGTNRRAGIFFFCSDPSAIYRGESYMVYFREESNLVEIYEASGGSISGIIQQATTPIDANVWYDYKITYNPASGDMNIYQNNNLVLSWKDTTPLTSGTGISFRTGGCAVEYDDMKVYTSRGNSAVVSVGVSASNQVRYESPNTTQDACRIRSAVIDNLHNWSVPVAKNIYIDWTIPQTTSSVQNTWQTTDFTIDFTDVDALSGVSRRFYQVLDFDNTSWRANPNHGFYCDVFDTLYPEWSIASGTWNISGNSLVQSDEALSNTNIYTFLKQDLSNRYLYDFNMKIEGIGSNRRGGFHYFCDDPNLTNRGNSFFIWFRIETQKMEFYKVENDIFSLEKIYDVTFNAGQWYNVKIIYDRITGEHLVYLDDVLVGEWLDPVPVPLGLHPNHSWISFRSGNSLMSVNNLKVYRTRSAQATITLGDSSKMIRYQNPNPFVSAAKIKSIVSDSAQNISSINYHDLMIDWTAPFIISTVNDGTMLDIDTSSNVLEFSANWSASSDPNSDILLYEYALGSSPGATDVVNWTGCGLNSLANITGLSLTVGQWYYFSVRAVNGAGLTSVNSTTDGVLIVSTVQIGDSEVMANFLVFPNPVSEHLVVQIFLSEDFSGVLEFYDVTGKCLWKQQLQLINGFSTVVIPINSLNIASGMYYIRLGNSVFSVQKSVIVQ